MEIIKVGTYEMDSPTTKLEHKTIIQNPDVKIFHKGLKHDEGKLRWDLLPFEIIEEIVHIYTFGSKKYADNSWQLVENPESRFFSALCRHLVAYRTGEWLDPESGRPHLAHCAWNVIALLWFGRRKHGTR